MPCPIAAVARVSVGRNADMLVGRQEFRNLDENAKCKFSNLDSTAAKLSSTTLLEILEAIRRKMIATKFGCNRFSRDSEGRFDLLTACAICLYAQNSSLRILSHLTAYSKNSLPRNGQKSSSSDRIQCDIVISMRSEDSECLRL